LLVALQRDLTEPLAYGVACAVYLFDFGGRRGVLGAGLAFGAAAVARETTIVFAVLFAVSILTGRPNASQANNLRDRLAQFAVFSLLALVPVAIWTVEWWAWLGTAEQGRNNLTAVPFGGIFAKQPSSCSSAGRARVLRPAGRHPRRRRARSCAPGQGGWSVCV
jgi:hypothetical protein